MAHIYKEEYIMSRAYFCDLHDAQGQKYANIHPYSFHLDMVAKQAEYFFSKVFDAKDVELKYGLLIACYGHDAIEDARLTYNDIKARTSEFIAEIVYLCTEQRGRNRAERKPESWYKELITNKHATFVKLCDLLANAKYSLLTNSTMYDVYKAELSKIEHHVKDPIFTPMLRALKFILNAQPL